MNKRIVVMACICVLSLLFCVGFFTTWAEEYRNYNVSGDMSVETTAFYEVRNDILALARRVIGRGSSTWTIPISRNDVPDLDQAIMNVLRDELNNLEAGIFISCTGTRNTINYSFQIASKGAGSMRQYINLEFNHDGSLVKKNSFSQ